MKNPYQDLPPVRYWRSGVAEQRPFNPICLYEKKFPITKDMAIATAGSCFAQHIGRNLRNNGFTVLDVEPPPRGLEITDQAKYGYSVYSARYGNIYTTRQLLQLAREAFGRFTPEDIVWQGADGKFYDALRPGVEPDGLDSPDEVLRHRRYHLKQVRKMFEEMDLFIFTMGLTETWEHQNSGTVFPTAPGTIAGRYSPEHYSFKNLCYQEVFSDFCEFREFINSIKIKNKARFLLTVSPVPLTATATSHHVMAATVYSKSVLRAAAGKLAEDYEDIDYFPSFEIITNLWAGENYYEKNMRSVNKAGVDAVMETFFATHNTQNAVPKPAPSSATCWVVEDEKNEENLIPPTEDVVCEEAILDAFAERQIAIKSF